MLDLTHLRLDDVQGVGTIELDLDPSKQAYVFIGANGVGKTKLLETIFQILLFTFKYDIPLENYNFITKKCSSPEEFIDFFSLFRKPSHEDIRGKFHLDDGSLFYTTPDLGYQNEQHENPIVFITAHQRGFIYNNKKHYEKLGTFEERKHTHIDSLLNFFLKEENISSQLPDIEQWFVKIAQNTNPFLRNEDKREIEIRTVLSLLNQLDSNIDSTFIEYDGGENVHIKVSGKDRQLSQLSTGFVSLVKIIQAIVSGYGYFTNTQDLQNVKGIVLIDEIESHLHLEWQVKIIPTLKKLFPNTTFFIATHSPLVLSQLEDGEAYELRRDVDDIVRTYKIKNPGNTAMIDLLKQAFHIDLNRLALDRPVSNAQKEAKKKLLKYLRERKAS